jgi:hypothetical protein
MNARSNLVRSFRKPFSAPTGSEAKAKCKLVAILIVMLMQFA